jgi:hypothetical protein
MEAHSSRDEGIAGSLARRKKGGSLKFILQGLGCVDYFLCSDDYPTPVFKRQREEGEIKRPFNPFLTLSQGKRQVGRNPRGIPRSGEHSDP